MVDFLIHNPRSMSFLELANDDDGTVLDFPQNVIMEYQILTQTQAERGKFEEANDIFGNKPGDKDICHHYHKHDKDHRDPECRGASLGQEAEVCKETTIWDNKEGKESPQESEDLRP